MSEWVVAAAKRGKQCHTVPHSEMAKLKISLKKRGVPIHSDEFKAALSARLQGNTYAKGKPWSAARRLAWLQNKEI